MDLEWDRAFALEQAGGDEEFLAELLALLRKSAMDDLDRIKSALAADDPRALADAAHNTKGGAASLGMENLRRVAHALEEAGRAGALTESYSLVQQLEQLLSGLPEIP